MTVSHSPILHGFPVSPHVRAARVVLAEKAISHEFREMSLLDVTTDAYGQINPFRLMPALSLPEGALYETPALLIWADLSGAGARLQPTEPFAAGQMWKFIGIAQNQLFKIGVMTLYRNRVLAGLFNIEPDIKAAEEAVAPTLIALDAIEGSLSGGHLAGGALSLADVYCGVMVDYIARTTDGHAALKVRPKTAAWLDALRQRPSFAATFAPMLLGTDQI